MLDDGEELLARDAPLGERGEDGGGMKKEGGGDKYGGRPQTQATPGHVRESRGGDYRWQAGEEESIHGVLGSCILYLHPPVLQRSPR